MSRDGVIEQVASTVGTGHSVNLRAYDLLIIVEIYKVSPKPVLQFHDTEMKVSLTPVRDA